jgi:hypothetical protein
MKKGDKVVFICPPDDRSSAYHYPVGTVLTLLEDFDRSGCAYVTPHNRRGHNIVHESEVQPYKKKMFNENA